MVGLSMGGVVARFEPELQAFTCSGLQACLGERKGSRWGVAVRERALATVCGMRRDVISWNSRRLSSLKRKGKEKD